MDAIEIHDLTKSFNGSPVLDEISFKVRKGEIFGYLGPNGSGKTTTIAKVTNYLQKNKLSVCLAAADTFRAAAIQQLEEHANKLKVPIIKKDYGSDPASVGFDAKSYAKKNKIDVLLIDTAGRMQNRDSLMQEIEKITRVNKPDMKIFIGESITGNDATEQAKAFNETINITGIILSKADVDEKGGTAISVSQVTGKPILFLGTGQKYKDLEIFDKDKMIEKLGL
ncbi:MAG: ATP-binding cassette domain-containing protein [Methanosarcinales archaeon]|nr:ATP-binding cassette domain-containing protein [Methanosarcinales archaeon]